MDRRQLKTREAIYTALTSLLNEKNFNKITVQEIIDLANIGRSTFYAHFETKDELLTAMCREICDHVFNEGVNVEPTHDFSDKEANLTEKLLHILYHFQDNKNQIHRIISGDGGEIFMNYFRKYLKNIFLTKLKASNSRVPKDYLVDQLVFSLSRTIWWWFESGSQYTPKDIAGFYIRSHPQLNP